VPIFRLKTVQMTWSIR